MKKILIIKEKHGNYAYDISTAEQSDKVYLSIFHKRKRDGWYDDIENSVFFDKEKFNNLQNGKIARGFLLGRCDDDYEYEEIEEMEIQEIKE